MKPTAAFKALTANRKARAFEAANHGGWNVRGIRKDGTPGAISKDYTGQTEFTLAAATEYAERLNRLNPGRTFVVTAAA